MDIEVNIVDAEGNTFDRVYHMSYLAFIKHMAFAGQGYAPRPQKLWRTLGMLLHYNQYLDPNAFRNNRFSLPARFISDPTEKGQFSNIAGKAIADFLSKKIDLSLFTVNYEAAMRLEKISIGRRTRPDLIAYTKTSMIAIEAKGTDKKTSGDMNRHKSQARSGPIPVNYSVASVSYNLYDRVKCNYHDPYNANVPYDHDALRQTSQRYYSGLLDFLNDRYFDINEANYYGESFFEIGIYYRNKNIRPILGRLFPYWDFFEFVQPRLLLPKKIYEYAEMGLTTAEYPFVDDSEKENVFKHTNFYIDNDRVGLRLNRSFE